MRIPAHKHDSLPFGKLTHAEQAKSINASINNLQNAIIHHIKHAPNPDEARRKCIHQVHRFAGRLLERLLIIALAVFFSLMIGCDRGSNSKDRAAKDPVSDFKAFVGKFLPELRSSYARGEEQEITAATLGEDVSFDVRKTDSLVSPYRGYLKFPARYQTSGGGHFEVATTESGSTTRFVEGSNYFVGTETLIFAMQDEKWVYKDHQFDGKFYNGDPGDSRSIGVHADTSPVFPNLMDKVTAASYSR